MVNITEKKTGKCDLDGKDRDEIYAVAVEGEKGEYALCRSCFFKIADLKLQRAGKVKAKPVGSA